MPTYQRMLRVMFSPVATFEGLRKCKASVAIAPLVLLFLAYSGTFCVYYRLVDFEWLRDELTSGVDPEHKASVMRSITVTAMTSGAVVGVLLSLPMYSLFYTTYLYLVGQIMNLEQSFEEWFALVNWSWVPSLLFAPVALVAIMLSPNGQVAPTDLNTTSINQLLLGIPDTSSWKTFADNFSVISMWSYALLVVGFHTLTKKSVLKSAFIPLAPTLVILAIWASIIAVKS